MKHELARTIAHKMVEQMRPFCERIEIAGSLRRGCSQVKDIEIVAIPRWSEDQVPSGLFGETETVRTNELHSWAVKGIIGRPKWIKPGTSEIIPWAPKDDGKYWRGLLFSDAGEIKLDLFLCTPQNWGAIFLIRTGSAEFSKEIAYHAKCMGRPFRDGRLTIAGVPVETPEERDVFELLNLRHIEPENRRGVQDVKREVTL